MDQENKTMGYLPQRARVDIEFQDLSFTVPQGRKGSKLILRSINGQFKAGQLTAILGPSGAGKSTLLNMLAGYKSDGATGTILINNRPRNIKEFRQMSRYIMQEDLIQPKLSVLETMMMAANLKLGKGTSTKQKENAISEILTLLRLTGTVKTHTNKLSGGEKKRLSIALELLNNPPVLFLDEPTTGLDDLSCSQCISLLKQISEGGRTVICSIHTPSAKLFGIFDNVYILSSGQCVYQGNGQDVVQFLSDLEVECPKHYNPADFIIEVCCGEYGDFQDRLVAAIDNGRSTYKSKNRSITEVPDEIPCDRLQSIDNGIVVQEQTTPSNLDENILYKNERANWATQFYILLFRMWKQMWRDTNYLALRTILHILIGILIGYVYMGFGKDGSKTIFNFGFYFTCLIFFMYIPMMPVLLEFPQEFKLIKREHFNRWYRLSAYFVALTASTLPLQIVLGSMYIIFVYILSDQPMEFPRLSMFLLICILTGIISESLGLLIASQLTVVNAMFVGPVTTVPFMLLAVYGFGSGYDTIPTLIKFAMHFSYLRYSLEGLIHAMLKGREKLACPDDEEFCIFTDLDFFIKTMGMNNTIFWVDIVALVTILCLFRGGSYYLLRQRLSPNKTFIALQYVGRFIKSFALQR